jgi:hypothetical protein
MGGRTEHLQQIGWTFLCVTEPKFELRALTGNMVPVRARSSNLGSVTHKKSIRFVANVHGFPVRARSSNLGSVTHKKSIRFVARVLFYHPYIVQGTTYPKMDPCVT